MSRANKCDRCGAYYDENKAFENFMNSKNTTYLRGVSVIDSEGARGKYFDLCDKCLKEFMVFVMDPDFYHRCLKGE